MKGLLILQVDFMSQIICPKCHERYESDMPRCLWCDAPNPVLNKNISPLPLQKHEVNKFSSLESRHSANNSLENKVHRNKRKLFFFSPLIFILIVLGLFLFFYTTATPFDVSVVLFLICSFLAFMFLLSPFFSEPLKIEENEDSLICHLFYGKKVVSLTGNCDYDIQFFSDGGWVISFRTGLLSVRFSNDAFADLSKIVDKLKDCPNSQKRNAFTITMNAVVGVVALIGGGIMFALGMKGGFFCVIGGLMSLFEIANETLRTKKQPGPYIQPAPPTFMEVVVAFLTLFPLLFAFMIFANEGFSVMPAFALVAGEACICIYILNYQKKVKKGMGIKLSFLNSAKYLLFFFFALGYLIYHFVVS